jgi:A/G-specific adenine glycosylase
MKKESDINSPDLFREALLDWFDANRRKLPWRGNVTPYGVLVSELMLQQTTVAAVIPYYKRWMKRFPSAASLARAEDEEVLRHWAGLGYYSRARSLHHAAQILCRDYNGRVPRDIAALRALPGVGAYTAAAVASIAYGVPEPAMDANAVRVYARLGAIAGSPAAAGTKSAVSQCAQKLIDPLRAGDYNQAIMELGALICAPAAPHCAACPVCGMCAAHLTDRVAEFPHPAPRPRTVKVQAGAALVLRDGAVLLRRRAPGQPMAGLWELPYAEILEGETPEQAAVRAARAQAGLRVDPIDRLFTVPHAFTHHRITVHVIWCRAMPRTRISTRLAQHAAWVYSDKLSDLPLTGAAMKILKKYK